MSATVGVTVRFAGVVARAGALEAASLAAAGGSVTARCTSAVPPPAPPSSAAPIASLAPRPAAEPPPESAAEPASGAAARRGGRAAAAAADRAEHGVLEAGARDHGQQQAERDALVGDRALVLAAGLAEVEVTAQRTAAQLAAAGVRELLADLLARGLARVALRDQVRARLVDERLDLGRRHADHRADLDVGHVGQLGEHERRALVLGEPVDVGQQGAQVRALLEVGRQPVRDGLGVGVGDRRVLARRVDRAAAVAGDGEQPRADLVGRPVRETSARWARRKVCWSASSPSSREPSMCRQKPSSAA